ncbi:MAG: S8 family serine peptidase [Thermus sp.]|uniref:S8 family peptidase n=1 Tax=Thermus sp. TaxID=275 RepID=UPI0025EC44A2|nr:S8 family serine peptidase [Thermus sp.]MCS7217645.1 S8 family serine peptidase [Thermus sp.]
MKPLALLGLLLGGVLVLSACFQAPPPPPPQGGCTPQASGKALSSQGHDLLGLQGLGDFSSPYAPGELLVLFGSVAPQALLAQVEGIQPLGKVGSSFFRVRTRVGQERATAQALLRAGARWVQPNYIYRPLALPNDPHYEDRQKSLLNGLVGLEAAWNASTGDPSLILAVVDTGYLPHEDMAGRWYLPPGETLDLADGDADPLDDIPLPAGRGHGLAVASILGAATNNAKGMAGVTWGGRILPLKAARSANGEMLTSYVAQAVDKAVALGAKVINLSLGGPASDPVLERALVQARSQGVVLVAAAGNGGGEGLLYPASSSSTLAVGSVNASRQKSRFSNCGPELDLVAPGEGVWGASDQDGYALWSGTSMAAPVVSGIAALYLSRYWELRGQWPTPDQVRLCLTATAQDLGPPGRDTGYGFGLVRADRVMANTTHCFP